MPVSHVRAEDLRYEPQFFRKRYLREQHELGRHPTARLGDVAYVTDGPHGYHVVDDDSPVAMLTASCVQDWFAERQGADMIAQWVDDANQRSRLAVDDLLLATRGTLGHVAIVTEECLPANIDQDVARIHLRSGQPLPTYLLMYLNTKYGQDYFDRYATGMVQQGVTLSRVRLTPFPIMSGGFQMHIDRAVRSASAARREAVNSLESATRSLADSLAIPAQNATPRTYARSAREALAAGRLDATYFSPAKQSMLDALARLPGAVLRDRFASIRSMFDPSNPGEVTRVRDYDLPDALQPILDDAKAPEPISAIGSMKKRLATDDVVISRLRAYLKEIAVVRAPEDLPAVGSSEFIVLRRREDAPNISPETLLAFLRSDPVQTILRYCEDGSQHPRLSEADLLSIPVPDSLVLVSPKITREVQAAFAARRRARALLDGAVRAVEIAIEDSEAAALTYLAEQTEA